MIEGTEEKMAAYMDRMITGMLKLIEDEKTPPEVKVNAARTVDGANDSFLKSKSLDEIAKVASDHSHDLLKQVKDLRDPKKPWED